MNGKRTAIEWTNWTWNPLTGCTRVTAGCEHCYAFALHDARHALYTRHAGRWTPGGPLIPRQYARPFTDLQLLPGRLREPLAVKEPSLVFVNSMSDLLHSQVPDAFIFEVIEVMRQAHWHTFQVLTKRAGRLRRLGKEIAWPPNVWMGMSIEQDSLTGRADALREITPAVRFLSCEPLLGPLPSLSLAGIGWVIVGGESGPHARPMREAWVCDLRDRAVAAGIPLFFKQWGGRTPKAGGRLLEGRTWDQMPPRAGMTTRSGSSEEATGNGRKEQ